LAQGADPDSRYPDQYSRDTPDIERQIQRLDDQINAEDRAGHISPSEADTLVRELRDVETQLLSVRSRTFHGNDNGNAPGRAPNNWNSAPRSAPYQGRSDPNDGGLDDNRDSTDSSASQ
jgi:hypothetical protein